MYKFYNCLDKISQIGIIILSRYGMFCVSVTYYYSNHFLRGIIMFCIHCGNQITDNEKFCSKCGKLISEHTSNPIPLKLYMPSKLSFVNYKFDLKDEAGNLKYTAISGAQGFTGYRMTLHNLSGKELVLVKQKSGVTFTAVNFEAYINGEFVTDCMQKASFTRYYYVLPQLNLKIMGDFIGHKYQVINEQGQILATISKKLMSFGDSYQIDIADSKNELLIIATVFAVEMMVMTLRRRRR